MDQALARRRPGCRAHRARSVTRVARPAQARGCHTTILGGGGRDGERFHGAGRDDEPVWRVQAQRCRPSLERGTRGPRAVVMRKRCPEHGAAEVPVAADADWYARTIAEAPRLAPPDPATAAPVRQGCPFDCGPCASHEQTVALPIVPITSACNLDCPICYTHNKNEGAWHMSEAELGAMLGHLRAAGARAPDHQPHGRRADHAPRLRAPGRAVRARRGSTGSRSRRTACASSRTRRCSIELGATRRAHRAVVRLARRARPTGRCWAATSSRASSACSRCSTSTASRPRCCR